MVSLLHAVAVAVAGVGVAVGAVVVAVAAVVRLGCGLFDFCPSLLIRTVIIIINPILRLKYLFVCYKRITKQKKYLKN